jgi:hypothetical protein
MATLDAGFRGLARSLSSAFGTDITITYVTAGSFNPTTQTATPSTSTSAVPAVISQFDVLEINGLVEAGDVKVDVPALGITEPKADDTVTIGSDVFQVVSVRTTYSGDQAALYELQVRR